MGATVLIIEDHEVHRTTIETALRDLPFALESSDSGSGALMRLGMADYGCVVVGSPVDVEFAGERSTILEMFGRLAPALASRLIVIVDPRAMAVIQRAIHLQVYAIFLAPFDAAELRAAVQRCLTGDPPPRRLHGASDEVTTMLDDGNVAPSW